jgi:hypothetical protein
MYGRNDAMRFMMLMIPKVYQGNLEIPSDFAPRAEDVEKMTRFNEELAKAGALISLDGLHPPATGARVSFSGGKPFIADRPFPGARDVLGGYWMISVNSREEAIAWAKKVPAQDGDVVEVRQVFEMEEFPEDVRKAGDSATVRRQLEKRG